MHIFEITLNDSKVGVKYHTQSVLNVLGLVMPMPVSITDVLSSK